MFLEKVKDLEQIRLGKNQVLVELIYKTQGSGNIIIAGEDGNNSTRELIKTEVIASEFEEVQPGDVLIEYRMMIGQNGMLKLGKRTFAIVAGFDIKIWTKPDNYDESKEAKKETSLIQEASKGMSKEEISKIEQDARGLKTKWLNNK